ncbi:MAG: hypothetical protein IRY99_02920 [Isosphaeraceae bacterium]|nr:hypothetical protein [Isosphaeraceae bacterium]
MRTHRDRRRFHFRPMLDVLSERISPTLFGAPDIPLSDLTMPPPPPPSSSVALTPTPLGTTMPPVTVSCN